MALANSFIYQLKIGQSINHLFDCFFFSIIVIMNPSSMFCCKEGLNMAFSVLTIFVNPLALSPKTSREVQSNEGPPCPRPQHLKKRWTKDNNLLKAEDFLCFSYICSGLGRQIWQGLTIKGGHWSPLFMYKPGYSKMVFLLPKSCS